MLEISIIPKLKIKWLFLKLQLILVVKVQFFTLTLGKWKSQIFQLTHWKKYIATVQWKKWEQLLYCSAKKLHEWKIATVVNFIATITIIIATIPPIFVQLSHLILFYLRGSFHFILELLWLIWEPFLFYMQLLYFHFLIKYSYFLGGNFSIFF